MNFGDSANTYALLIIPIRTISELLACEVYLQYMQTASSHCIM